MDAASVLYLKPLGVWSQGGLVGAVWFMLSCLILEDLVIDAVVEDILLFLLFPMPDDLN